MLYKRIIKLVVVFLVITAFGVCALPGAGVHVFASDDDAADPAQQTEEPNQGEDSPASPVEIQDDEIPLIAMVPQNQFIASYNFTAWALLNLILVIATGLIMLGILIFCIRRLKAGDANERGYRAKRARTIGLGIIAVGATIVSVVLLSITQDMSLPMIYMDNWTVWHVIIAVVIVLVAEFERKRSEDADTKKNAQHS